MRIPIVITCAIFVTLVMAGCESEQVQQVPAIKKLPSSSVGSSSVIAADNTQGGVYNYEHKIQKGEETFTNIGQDRPPLKYRIAVARFGDLLRPGDSPFTPANAQAIESQETIDVQADKEGISLQQTASARVDREMEPCPAFTGMLVEKLVESGRFIVLERKEINKLLREQDFDRLGRVLPQTAARLQQVRGVELIITGEVAKINNDTQNETLVVLRVYNVETSEVIASGSVQACSEQEAVNQAAAKVINSVENVGWSAKVSQVYNNGIVVLNCGEKDGIYEGDRFRIYSLGPEILDPDEGTVLGRDKVLACIVEVVKTDEKFCKTIVLAKRKGALCSPKDTAEYIEGPYSDDYSDYEEQLEISDDDREEVEIEITDFSEQKPKTGPENIEAR